MTVVDELKKRQRAVSLMFFDFVEVCEAHLLVLCCLHLHAAR